jgi:hypothetical protein
VGRDRRFQRFIAVSRRRSHIADGQQDDEKTGKATYH